MHAWVIIIVENGCFVKALPSSHNPVGAVADNQRLRPVVFGILTMFTLGKLRVNI